MSLVRILSLLAAVVGLAAVEVRIIAVPAADRVVANVGGIPVVLGFAHIEVPTATADATRQQLVTLIEGKTVRIDHDAVWGTDANGAGRIHIHVGQVDVAVRLVEEGLAKLVADIGTAGTKERLLATSQERAQRAKKGVWAEDAPATVVAASKPAPAPAPRPAAPAPRPPATSASAAPAPLGAFASELNNRYFYPSDHRALANVPRQRLIYYADEAAAKRAGKLPSPDDTPALQGEANESAAEAIFAKGERTYSEAIAAGNSSRRDQLYGEAFKTLTEAMNIYGELVEKDESNATLAEKLRRCMQLRYGAMKQKRPN